MGGLKDLLRGLCQLAHMGKLLLYLNHLGEKCDWLDDFVISNGVIPSIADIKKEAESRSGKWTLSNVKIEYQF
jgi:hypothetical protein